MVVNFQGIGYRPLTTAVQLVGPGTIAKAQGEIKQHAGELAGQVGNAVAYFTGDPSLYGPNRTGAAGGTPDRAREPKAAPSPAPSPKEPNKRYA